MKINGREYTEEDLIKAIQREDACYLLFGKEPGEEINAIFNKIIKDGDYCCNDKPFIEKSFEVLKEWEAKRIFKRDFNSLLKS